MANAIEPFDEAIMAGEKCSLPGEVYTESGGYDLLADTLHVSVSKHLIDEHFTLIWANKYYYEFIGYPQAEYEKLFHNQPDLFWAHAPEDMAVITEHVVYALEHNMGGYECVTGMDIGTEEGPREHRWVKFAATFLDEYLDGYQLSYTTMTDVTDLVEARNELGLQKLRLEEANKDLERLAFVDPVTEGCNQTRFDRLTAERMERTSPYQYALVAFDLKKFKILNDIQGTQSGDMVLRYVHDCLQSHLYEDEVLARISADTFNVLMRVEPPETMTARIDAIVQDINKFNTDLERPYFLTFSVGVYPITDPTLPITIMRDRANVARNSSKETVSVNHFSCVFYDDAARQNMLTEQVMENRMRRALEHGEFVAYYQPKQTLASGTIGGAEALVRWADSEHGLIPPDEFVPFFEKNGFIVDVDLCVFEQVCALLSSWIEKGRNPIPISVNMSRVHLREQDFITPYEKIRKKYDVPAALIEFELTESLVFGDPETFMKVIDVLHARGYRCSLDDFGSGYSSLNVLKDVDIDTMKLDRAFFSTGEAAGQREWDIVESVVDLAKKLELETVAEGVEDPDQVDRLRDMECDMLQGYVFSRPVPVQEFERLLFDSEKED